jgi:hypothetical protein
MNRFSPAQASQDPLRWRRMLHRFARHAGVSGLTSRRRESASPDPAGQMTVFGPCCGDDARPASARSRPSARRQGRHRACDAEMEASR